MRTAQAVVVPSRIAANGDCEDADSCSESIRAGLPVVASNQAGIPEIIRDQETGFLVPENDPDALAAALSRVLRPDDYIQQMVVNAQASLRKDFNAAIQSDKLRRYLLGIKLRP